jgi:hypothetical protein
VNKISKIEGNARVSFENACKSHKIHDKLEKGIDGPNLASQSTSVDHEIDFESAIETLRQKEIEKITEATMTLELELTRLREQARRLRGQTEHEIAAALQICQQLSIAAAQCSTNVDSTCSD